MLMTDLEYLTDDLGIYHSAVTIGVICDDNDAILIDCDDGSVIDEIEATTELNIQKVVFTHYHRDSAGGATGLAHRDIDIAVPAAESRYFQDVHSFWSDPDFRFRRYESFHPHHLLLPESVQVDEKLEPGESLNWGDSTITAISTPGHTQHGLSYLVKSSDQRYVFTGDTICGDGQLWNAYSLQYSTTELTDYHSFLGARHCLMDGLQTLLNSNPEILIPLRGTPIGRPKSAIDRLSQRLRAAYSNYVRIAALRHYYPGLFEDEEPSDAMPIRDGINTPGYLRHIGTSWILCSENGPCLLVDCGSDEVLETLDSWENTGDIDGVEGLWISHYHYDHIDAVPEFLDAYDGPIMAQKEVADVLEQPSAYRLPVLSSERVPIDRRLADGESWEWHEWTLTAYWLPGQTYYHGGLLAEGNDLRLLFVGDAFTMAGLDDYCTYNRNLLGTDRGFDRCLRLVEELNPTHLFNCHIERAFNFTPEELRFMRDTLAKRIDLFDELLAWEHPNFGLDPYWVRCHPYHQTRTPGDRASISVSVMNYASKTQRVAVRPCPPSENWNLRNNRDQEWIWIDIDPREEATITLPFRVPNATEPRTAVIPIDIQLGDRQLPQFREGIVTVQA
jgi:glyoxylase-like metal-dependent hydrolase (beta-lactamase superfamily II)